MVPRRCQCCGETRLFWGTVCSACDKVIQVERAERARRKVQAQEDLTVIESHRDLKELEAEMEETLPGWW